MPALLGAALAGLLLLASSAGRPVLVGGLLVVQVIVATGGIGQVAVPAARSAGWLALAVGATATLGAALAGAEPDARIPAAALGLAFVAAVVGQLFRRAGRPRLTASLTLAVAGAVLTAPLAWWLLLRAAPHGRTSVALGLVGVAAVLLVEAVAAAVPARARPWLRAVGAVGAAGAGAGLAAASWPEPVARVSAAVVAGGAGLLALAALAVVDALAVDVEAPVEPAVGGAAADVPVLPLLAEWALRAALPLSLAATPAYLLGRLLIG